MKESRNVEFIVGGFLYTFVCIFDSHAQLREFERNITFERFVDALKESVDEIIEDGRINGKSLFRWKEAGLSLALDITEYDEGRPIEIVVDTVMNFYKRNPHFGDLVHDF